MDITDGKGGIGSYLLDIFYPNRCPFCDGFIPYNKSCCEECSGEILWADENICLGCGKSVLKGCLCDKVSYDNCVAAAYYAGGAKLGIYNLKFRSLTGAADIFGRVIAERLEILGLMDEIDAAVAVPMTKSEKRKRGYNQAELIAKAVIGKRDIPLIKGALIRKNVKVSQHELSAKERAEAVCRQYEAAENIDLSGKTILLTDDVVTTGATLDRCAYLLKEKLHVEKVICGVCTTV